jgi:hypothetical protein
VPDHGVAQLPRAFTHLAIVSAAFDPDRRVRPLATPADGVRDAGEVMAAVQTAMVGGLPYTVFATPSSRTRRWPKD